MKKIIAGVIVIFFIIGGYQFYSISKEKKQAEKQNNTVSDNNSMNSGNINEENWDVKPNDLEINSNNPVGETPQFTLENLNGKKVSLEQFKGKKVFINFWATWCPPCQAEMPELQKVYNDVKDNKDIVILTINVGESNEKVSSFMKEHGYDFEVLLDKDSEVGLSYKARYLPTSVLINKEGKIEKYRSGAMDYSQMTDFIK